MGLSTGLVTSLSIGLPRYLGAAIGIACAALTLACSGPGTQAPEGSAATPTEASPSTSGSTPATDAGATPVRKGSLREHPAQTAWELGSTPPAEISIAEAEARGLVVVDLSDDWVPYVFRDKTEGLEDTAKNDYRATYVALANDRVDSDGDPLPSQRHNFLELYGIPPTLSVLAKEWDELESGLIPCLAREGFDPKVFAAFGARGLAFEKGKRAKEAQQKASWYRGALEKQMRKLRLDPSSEADLAKAATHPKTRALYERQRGFQAEYDVVRHAQIHFACAGLFHNESGLRGYAKGEFDHATSQALAAFEKKHDLRGWGHFTPQNLAALARPPHELVYERLRRTIEERVVSAAGILEDGSTAEGRYAKFRWKDEAGQEHALRNVTAEATAKTLETLGLTSAETARARLRELAALEHKGFAQLLVAVKLPPLPAYYAENMDLEVVIDRGDIWYDFPYSPEGRKLAQPRRRFPHLTLFVRYRDQRIPLVHWRTTIGSWRTELHEGEVMLKYKNSDVGERVWKDIVAGPVWIPPPATPAEDILKRAYREGRWQTVINYDETGPGYRSAYGLVAAYHIRQVFNDDGSVRAELDNQIRTHGSVDYMSILRRFSHGCHRLYNMEAVRMFSFILRHRPFRRIGQEPIGFRRRFEHEGVEYRLALDTRGYKYELVEPVPVNVTKGTIRGKLQQPIEDYVPVPGAAAGEAPADAGADGGFSPASPDP